jgi:hypothetical protein
MTDALLTGDLPRGEAGVRLRRFPRPPRPNDSRRPAHIRGVSQAEGGRQSWNWSENVPAASARSWIQSPAPRERRPAPARRRQNGDQLTLRT